jgi:hypothetical protein
MRLGDMTRRTLWSSSEQRRPHRASLSECEREKLYKAGPAEHPYQHRPPKILSRRQPRELDFDEVEIVLDRVEVAAGLAIMSRALFTS